MTAKDQAKLDKLRSDRDKAQQEGDTTKVAQLDEQIRVAEQEQGQQQR